ncbi:class I SAM-dependent methyltransferase [Candidatus Sumerlaeota bacterium]
MRRLIAGLLSEGLKRRIKQSNFYTTKTARGLALTSKRIDICAAQFAQLLHLSKYGSLEGKTCLEIGAGWVLTHALVCYLLGARRVIATDVVPCARPEMLTLALKGAIASIPRDLLAPFADHADIRARYDKLLAVPRFSFERLEEFGIEYHSPVDLAAEQLPTPVDFVYSNSVLEHVPHDDARALLSNLVGGLNPGGAMIHCIHLEDHKNTVNEPFKFLAIAGAQYSRAVETDRGNRIRCSEWREMFGELAGTNTELLYRYSRLDKPLPEAIVPGIVCVDEADLRTSHLGVYTRKEA